MSNYTVHRVFNGKDSVLGTFRVEGDNIVFTSKADELNCSMFPPGPMSAMTQQRLKTLLDNEHKSVYLTRG